MVGWKPFFFLFSFSLSCFGMGIDGANERTVVLISPGPWGELGKIWDLGFIYQFADLRR